MYDPGLFEAREVVDIPVMGTMESAAMVALMMVDLGRKAGYPAVSRIGMLWAKPTIRLLRD